MAARYPGFPAEGLEFLRELEQNNNREWFTPRKHVFEESVKSPMIALVKALNAHLMRFAPDYASDEPEKTIYRIYRDTRFSPDKTPYKTHIAAFFVRRGMQKSEGAGLYLHISPKEVMVAGGSYQPGPEQLLAIRTYIAEHYEHLRRILASRTLKKQVGELMGDQLSRVPKGFPSDHPAADLLRYKSWVVYVNLEPALVLTPGFLSDVLKRFESMIPLCEFLNEPLLAKRKKTAFLA